MTNDVLRTARFNEPYATTPHWVLYSSISATAKTLYTALNAHVNQERGDHIAWPGMDTLAVVLGYKHRQSIAKFVKELVAIGAIEVTAEKWARGRRNVYTIFGAPPDWYTGPRTQAEFLRRLRAAAEPPAGDAVPPAAPAPPQNGHIVAGQRGSHAYGCDGSHAGDCDGSHADACENNLKRNKLKGNNLLGHADARPHVAATPEWLNEDNPDLIQNLIDAVEAEYGWKHWVEGMVQGMAMDEKYTPLNILNAVRKKAREEDESRARSRPRQRPRKPSFRIFRDSKTGAFIERY